MSAGALALFCPGPRKSAAALLTVAALFLLALGCGAKTPGIPGCKNDQQCATGNVCMLGICLPRGMDRSVAIDIQPRTDSPAARTGIASVALGPSQIALAADEQVVVEGTVTNAPNAHVVITVPSPIPGQADLEFQTELANFKFQKGVGSRQLRSMATIKLLPNVEDQPPVIFKSMLDSTLNFTFPTMTQMTTMRGALRDAINMPPSAFFFVRALVDNQVVSNVAATDAAGMYQLLIAPGSVADGAQVTIDFTPIVPDSSPRFQSAPFAIPATGSVAPRSFRMPASVAPISVQFVVQSADKGALPLGDVTMRFRTEIVGPAALPNGPPLAGEPDGVAIFEREVRTDSDGQATVSLIPGTALEPRNYQITIIPPPNSPYATKCMPQQPMPALDSDGQTVYANTFVLEPKVTMQGTVLASDGSAAATVSVMATPLSLSADCPSPVAASRVSATTLGNGTYQMLIDPGTYLLDIDPPVGSPVPRLTEEAVLVTNDPVTNHDVTLPAGEVIEGDVKGFDNMPLGSASLRIFQVLCHDEETCGGPARIPPALRAQTRTEMSGHFRAVLPLP